MSFLAKLYINQQEYTLLDSTFPIYQHMAFDGRPDRLPEGGMLNLQVESTRDRFFVDWMISPSMMAEGRIRYFRRDGISRLFDVEFWDAYCVYYCEDFDHTGPRPLTTRIIISPGVTRYAGSLIEKSWKVTDLEQLEAAPTTPYRQQQEEQQEQDVKFVAHLERPDSYDGAFGFDWMRPHYREICEDYELLKKKYTPFTIDGEEYFTPWLSMFPGQKDVTLQLKVDVNEGTPKDDDIITLPATGGIRFEPAQVKVSEADGREITVHCEAPVATNTGIQLLDKDGETVGKINIFKNANHAQLQFDIIPVRILRGSSQKADAATIEGQIDTGFGNHSTNLSADLQNLQHYLNHHCLNQALLSAKWARSAMWLLMRPSG